jgi:hypothetical protein
MVTRGGERGEGPDDAPRGEANGGGPGRWQALGVAARSRAAQE